MAPRRPLLERPCQDRSARPADRTGYPRRLLFADSARARSYVLAAFGIIATTTHDPCGSGAAELPCRCRRRVPEAPIIAALSLLTATAKPSRATKVSQSRLPLVILGNTDALVGAAMRVLLACRCVPCADSEERDGKPPPEGITPRSLRRKDADQRVELLTIHRPALLS